MTTTPFTKMHGLGNDFVVMDSRVQPVNLTSIQVQALSNRNTGIGCDQVIVLEPPNSAEADIYMRIYNADGSEVSACGNATRCIADFVMDELGSNHATVETRAGLLPTTATKNGITVNFGKGYENWENIPLANEADTLHLNISEGILSDPVCVNIGNPHLVFFVDKIENLPLKTIGPK